MSNKNLRYMQSVVNLKNCDEIKTRSPLIPYIQIYRILGSSQLIVSTGMADYNFIHEDDAQRFVQQWFATQEKLPIRNLSARQVC